jgi:hypothetical protein
MPVSRSKRPFASTASCASEPISESTASMRRLSCSIAAPPIFIFTTL